MTKTSNDMGSADRTFKVAAAVWVVWLAFLIVLAVLRRLGI